MDAKQTDNFETKRTRISSYIRKLFNLVQTGGIQTNWAVVLHNQSRLISKNARQTQTNTIPTQDETI
jgi:hypothetical protein